MKNLSIAAVLAAASLYQGLALGEEVDCKNPHSQAEMTYCAWQSYDKVDVELNVVYKKVKSELTTQDADFGTSSVKKLVANQLKWIALRDADCELARDMWMGGSGSSMGQALCLANETAKRTQFLKTQILRNEEN